MVVAQKSAPLATMRARGSATHFLTKTPPQVATEMPLSVFAYNLTRVINVIASKSLPTAIAA